MDYDIDSGNFATFSIDNNGLLQLWSPYADLSSELMMKASETLPTPSGEQINFVETSNVEQALDIFRKYGNLFTVRPLRVYNNETKEYDISQELVQIDWNLDTPNKIVQLGQMLREYRLIYFPSDTIARDFLFGFTSMTRYVPLTQALFTDIFLKLKEFIDFHNMYYDNVGSTKLTHIINNKILKGMYDSIIDPVNLIQAQTSVDGTTGPLKAVGDSSPINEEIKTRTSGNFFNKNLSIEDNQTGKQCTGISAVGLKTFFALTQYNNYTLNNGSSEEQERLLFNHLIGGKRYRTIANIRSLNLNSVVNDEVLNALSLVNNTLDAALILSSLLSLSVDNAKELLLSKLNAKAGTIGMYSYGIMIGMNFEDIARLLMSPEGRMISSLMLSDVYNLVDSYSRAAQVFDYFEKAPARMLSKFDIFMDLDGNRIAVSPLVSFRENFLKLEDWIRDKDNNPLPFNEALAVFASSGITLLSKFESLEKLRLSYRTSSSYAREVYNLLIDFVEEYTRNLDMASLNQSVMDDLKTLAEGAEELFNLGLILSLNQGIKTDSLGFLRQINNIERLIYNKTNDDADIIDLVRFAFDENYRNDMIKKYDEVKHTVNILDVVSKIPHYLGYILTLATSLLEAELSFKFRTARRLAPQIAQELNYRREDEIIDGINRYVGDYLRKEWMLGRDIRIIIPKGNKAFDRNGNEYTLTQDTPVMLGTDWGDATFRMFMENTIIPDLKAGRIKPNTVYSPISDNKFIKELSNDLLTYTISRNPTIVYTLPINMMPRTNAERAIFNLYKAEFNKLAQYGYQYNVTSYTNDGIELTSLSNPLPLSDLFTYYAMIADSWRLSEKSLVPILEDFLNTGLIKNFHDFEAIYDKSGRTLTLSDTGVIDILPYVSPHGSPYNSYVNSIWYRNPITRKMQLMRKMSRQELEEVYDDDQYEYNPNVINGYTFRPSVTDTNYFPTGEILENQNRTVRHQFTDDNRTNDISIEYDIETGNIRKVNVNHESMDIGLDKIPIIKENGTMKVDMNLIESIVKSKMNPC